MLLPLLVAAVVLWQLVINVRTFAAFADDKRRSVENRQRIPEAELLRLVGSGGGLGALLAMALLRHKTRKQPFNSQVWGVIVGQTLLCIAVAGAVAWLVNR